jgi:DNA-binding SARP family transcriptional activator
MLINHQLVTYFVWNGEFSRASLIVRHLSREAAFDGAAPMARITHALAEAIYTSIADADARACHQAVHRGLELAEKSGIHVWDGQLLGQGAWSALMEGDADSGGHYLERMNTLLNPERRLEYSMYHHLRGWYALLNRDLPLAMEHTMEALRLGRETGVIMVQALNHQTLALIFLTTGRHEDAYAHLEQALKSGRGKRSGLLRFFRHLIHARALFVSGRNKRALDELRQGLEIGRWNGYWTTPWWHAPTMAQLCMKALDAGIETEYVRELIRRRHLIPDRAALEIRDWPWPVRISTLGGFALQIDGKPYEPTGKAQQKPLDLLKYVVGQRGRNVHQDTLVDALWPDTDGDKARQALSTTLHRLRKVLGHDDALHLRQGRLSLDKRLCWLDIREMEYLFDEMDSAISEGRAGRKKARDISQKIYACYRGDFMAGEPNVRWFLSCRERLRSRLLRQLGRLGRYWEEMAEWKSASDVYLRALEVDNLIEEFYQRLMTCYWKDGRRAEALAVYRRCRDTLRTGLEIDPSEETERLHARIRAGT